MASRKWVWIFSQTAGHTIARAAPMNRTAARALPAGVSEAGLGHVPRFEDLKNKQISLQNFKTFSLQHFLPRYDTFRILCQTFPILHDLSYEYISLLSSSLALAAIQKLWSFLSWIRWICRRIFFGPLGKMNCCTPHVSNQRFPRFKGGSDMFRRQAQNYTIN